MARICGFLSFGIRSVDLSVLLAASHPLRQPQPFSARVLGNESAALATDHLGDFATSPDGRYVCALDGRIFNLTALARELGRKPARDGAESPAAVLLEHYQKSGATSFGRLRGGFVAAILDTREKRLVILRDRFGVKTVFYSRTPHGLVFSSSLAGLASEPWVNRKIGMPGLLEFFACGYISAPWTIYDHVWGLRPGQYAVVNGNDVTVESYSELEPAQWRLTDTQAMSDDDLIGKLDELVARATALSLPRGRQVAAYLSGGLDTSLLCAALKEQQGREVVTYTLGFDGGYHDETPYAKAVAENLGIEHRVHVLKKDEALETLWKLPDIYGQPFADISAIPTCVIARTVSSEFAEVYGGEGPDFLFGNFDLRALYYYHRWTPAKLRQGISALASWATNRALKRWTSPNLDVAELLRQPEFFWMFTRMFKSGDLERLVGEPLYAESFWCHRFLESRRDIPVAERLRLTQYLCYGINDVLYKAGCAHNASLVELICPFYDPELYEFIQFLPTRYKFRRLYGKYLQKQLLFRKIPPQFFDRPKRGFIMDFVEFGLGTTRELTDRFLNRKRLADAGLVDADFAVKCVQDYYAGDSNMGPKLWTLLMFEMWREKFHV